MRTPSEIHDDYLGVGDDDPPGFDGHDPNAGGLSVRYVVAGIALLAGIVLLGGVEG